MTMPHLMNCSHSPDGWCLDCVKGLWEQYDKLKELSECPPDCSLERWLKMLANLWNECDGGQLLDTQKQEIEYWKDRAADFE